MGVAHANPGIERKTLCMCKGAVWRMAAWRESLAFPRDSSKTSQNLPSALRIVLDTTSQQSIILIAGSGPSSEQDTCC